MPKKSLLERGACNHGHPVTEENVIYVSGKPRCAACYDAIQKNQQSARKNERTEKRVASGAASFDGDIVNANSALTEAEREKRKTEIIARSPAAQQIIAQKQYEAFLNEKINPEDPHSITWRELEATDVVPA